MLIRIFAFAGWISQALMFFIVLYIYQSSPFFHIKISPAAMAEFTYSLWNALQLSF